MQIAVLTFFVVMGDPFVVTTFSFVGSYMYTGQDKGQDTKYNNTTALSLLGKSAQAHIECAHIVRIMHTKT